MVKTSLGKVLEKLKINKRHLAKLLNMRAAWFSDFDNGKHARVHLGVINRIIEYAKVNGVELKIDDFFTES